MLAQIARAVLGVRGAHDAVLYFALYPVGFVLTSLYSEGLFLALASGSFLAAMRGRPLLAGVLGGFATGTRLIGLALLPALAILSGAAATDVRSFGSRPAPAPGRGRPLRALPRLDARRPLGVHERAGGLEPRGVAAWAARRDPGRRPLRRPGTRDLLDLPAGGPGNEQRVGLWNLSHLVLLAIAVWLTWVAWTHLGAAFGAYSAGTLVIVLSAPAEGFPLVSLPAFCSPTSRSSSRSPR